MSYSDLMRGLVATMLLSVSPLMAVAIEIGDRVKVRDGAGFREGTVVGELGGLYRVQYDDGRMPTDEYLAENFFISDTEIAKKQQGERTGRLYQAIGRGLGKALGLAALIFAAFWYTRRRNRPHGTDTHPS